ncbi:MAG: endonuclease I [Oceanospirillaceae bacterium]|nr:endonuclease I [Oceanospirillaceae bacterium]
MAVIDNGNFEQWSGTTPDSWSTIDSGISVAPSSTVYNGSQAAAITVNTGSQSSTDFRQSVDVVSGTTYDFSVQVYHTEGNVKARMYVDGYQNYSNNTQTDQWQQLSYSYTASTTGSIEVGLRFYDQSGFDGSEVVYIDGFAPANDSTSDNNGGGNTGGSTGGSCVATQVNLTTDNYGTETSWTITNGSGTEVASGNGYSSNQTVSEDLCLDADTYTFTINDSYGDGICCSYGNGSYSVLVDGVEVASGGQFTSSEATDFTVADNSGGSTGGGSTGGGTGGSCAATAGVLSLTTDNYGSETSWSITNSSGTEVASGNGYGNNQSYSEDVCLDDDSYTFTISDSYGDGICCSHGNGSYSLAIDGSVVASGASFSSNDATDFTVGAGNGGNTGGGTGGTDLTGYYASANGLTGYTLKSELHNIIDGHNTRGYSALWTFYDANSRDVYFENDGTILDIYSENPNGTDPYSYTSTSDQCGSYSGEGSCYNREHSFPRSWFGGSVEPMNSDVHHIFATDGYVNGRRSSYPYGEVGSATYTSQNGSKVGSAASGLGYSGTVFEPIDEFKGDLARAYFYMATRYEDVIANWESNSSYSNAVLNGSSSQVFEAWFLNMLLSWHANDPVSQKEINRNEAAYTYQGNRNPFVDHPELVNSIWGN